MPRKPSTKRPDTAARPSLPGTRILVVEDDPTNAKLMAILLRSEDCDVKVVGSAEAALAVIPTFEPRVIVLDLVLPRLGGVALAELLKQDPATRGIVLIAVSSISAPATERLMLKVGCAAYVQKPIDALNFSRLVESHLAGPS